MRNIDDWEIISFEEAAPDYEIQGRCVMYESKATGLYKYEVFDTSNTAEDYVKARGTGTLMDIIAQLIMLKYEWRRS